MKNIKKFIIPIVIGTGLVTLIFYKLSSNKETMEAKAAIGNTKTLVFPVTITKADYETINQSVSANGIFNPAHTLMLMSDISGRVVQTNIKDGVSVRKGQEVVVLYNESVNVESEQTKVDKALALQTIEKAKNDLAKYQAMFESNAATKQQVEDQKMVLRNAEARLNTLSTIKRSTKIVAPMSGIVNKSYIEVGSYLSPGTNIAEIIDNSSLKLQVPVLDREVIKLSIGQNVQVVPDLYPNINLLGKITYIGAKADANRNFLVDILVPNSAKTPLRAGMSGIATIVNPKVQASLLLPTKCIVGSLQDPQVYVLNGNIAMLKKIKVGQVQGDKVVVLEGLSTEDAVVETGQANISNGAKVQVTQ